MSPSPEPVAPAPVVPDYQGRCITSIIPHLLGHPSADLPVEVGSAKQTVLLVLDGLGWEQLRERAELAPTLSAMAGGPITTVAPSTTATALTSLTTGLTPGEHGLVGYRMAVGGVILNTLRWGSNEQFDLRRQVPPPSVQPHEPFLGQRVSLVSKAEFRQSGFSEAHLRGAELVGYRTTATLVHEVARLIAEQERFVYAYYDGVDKVSHEYGFGSVFDAEVAFADRLVADVAGALPEGAQLVVTADHGQVDCRRTGPDTGLVPLAGPVRELASGLSGEGRFRWVHAKNGAATDLLAAAEESHRQQAWVRSLEQLLDEHWFGRAVSPEARSRFGDVALAPFVPIAFEDPADSGPFELIGRHGSLTAQEMYVPLLATG